MQQLRGAFGRLFVFEGDGCGGGGGPLPKGARAEVVDYSGSLEHGVGRFMQVLGGVTA